MNNPPWIFEPCENEDGRDDKGTLYPHAVRGMKPQGRRVMGYGNTEPDAYTDAREKAQRYDAREVLGERGEVLPQAASIPSMDIETLRRTLEEWRAGPHEWKVPTTDYVLSSDTDLLTRYGGLS